MRASLRGGARIRLCSAECQVVSALHGRQPPDGRLTDGSETLPMKTASLLALLLPSLAFAAPKKVVYVNSYNAGFGWSDGEERSAVELLKGSGVDVKTFYMDTKRNPDEKFAKDAGAKARAFIEAEKPDLVVVADDQAVANVLQPFYRDAALPFVFCGVNWDASRYGLPYRNATGMVEVNLTKTLVQTLRQYAKGDRVGFLAGEQDAAHKDLKVYREKLGIDFAEEKFVTTLADWTAAYAALQDRVDILIVYSAGGVKDWDEKAAAKWSLEHAKVPSGTIQDFVAPLVDLAMAKVPQEQGTWAARTALAILGGAAPSSIPLSQNKEAKLFVNVAHASRIGVVFKPELVRSATIIGAGK